MRSDLPSQMKAVVYRGIRDLRLESVPVPRLCAKELLVKVAVCGVCPTDIKKIHYGTVPPPRIFGHETAGTVVGVGNGLNRYRVGDRVALHHHVPCLRCHACRHHAFAQCARYKRTGITAGFEPAGGGYAEYVRVMPFVLPGVVPIPDRNDFVEGALLEPVNTVLKGVRRLGLQRGDTVMVVGQGPIGLLFTRLLVLKGARVLAVDLLAARLAWARAWGARWAVSGRATTQIANTVDGATAGRGLDAVVVAVPVDSVVQQAFRWVRGGGKVLLFAHTRFPDDVPVDLGALCVQEKDLLGSYSSDITLQDEVAGLVFSRKLDVRRLVTHRFSLSETAAAVALAAAPRADSLKIVVEMASG